MSAFKLIDEKNTYIDDTVKIGKFTVIHPNVFIKGNSVIGDYCEILPGTYIENSVIQDYVVIESSKIINSELGSHINVGPFAHIRENSKIADHTRIGNFVEFKNVTFGEHSKCAHLTYLGDTIVGAHVNIGCGVVSVNYDGVNKFKTIIEDYCFIGSNVNLIAPIHVKAKAIIAAGSTVTDDIYEGELAIARNKQVNKKDYGYRLFEKKQLKKGGTK